MNQEVDPLDEVIASYLRAADTGHAPSRDELLAAHPAHAAELGRFLDGLAEVPAMVEPFGAIESATRSPGSRTVDPTLNLEPGGRVRYFGDYELIDEIARGGMGVVYKARQVSLNRPVALKMILSGHLASDDELRRFQREAEAAAALDHPGIVPIHEIGVHHGQHYFSMQLIEGPSLAEALPELVGSWTRAAELVRAVADAVEFGHRRGILHRDLKPGNILLDRDQRPHVTDFGLAKKISRDDLTLTGSGDLLGTPTHMAPEQAAGDEVTTATDVWSLGVVLYQLLAGVVPFRATTPFETLRKVREDEVAPPSRSRPGIPRDLETICSKCLEKDPSRRYGTAGELADDLGRYLAGEPIVARPVGTGERVLKWARRRPAAAALVAVSGLAIVSALIGGLLFVDYQAEAMESERQLRQQADVQRGVASEQRTLAEARERDARQLVYASGMALAFQAWGQGDTKSVEALLARQTPPEGVDDLRGIEWRMLRGMASDAHHVWSGGGFVLHAPEHGVLVTQGDVAEEITLREPATGKPIVTLDAYPRVTSVPLDATVSADGSTAATGARHYTSERGPWLEVRIWNLAARQRMAAFDVAIRSGRTGTVNIGLSEDGATLAVYDGWEEFSRWDTATGRRAATRKLRIGGAAEFRFTGEALDFVRIRRARGSHHWVPYSVRDVTGEAQENRLALRLPSAWCRAAWSDDGRYLAIGSEDGEVGLFDRASGATLHVRRGHRGITQALAFSRDNTLLASGGRDGVVRVWEVGSGRQRHILRGNGAGILQLAFTSASTLVGATGRDLLTWSLFAAEERIPLGNTSPAGARFCVSADGEPTLLCRSYYNEPFKLRRLGDGSTVADRAYGDPDSKGTIYLAASTDGSVVAVKRSDSRAIRLWRGAAATSPAILPVDGKETGRITLSPDGTRLAITERQRGIHVFDLRTDTPPTILEHGRLGYVHGFAFSPDGRWLACAGQVEEELVIVDTDAGRLHRVLHGTKKYERYHGPVFSRDGGLLAVAPLSGGIEVWDTGTWTRVLRSSQRTKGILHLSFAPDGRTIAAGSEDGTVSLFHVATGLLMATLPAHATRIEAVAFTPDGTKLMSAAHRDVRIWHIPPR